MPAETMQQYIVRREQDFKRLEEVLAGAKIPDHIRAMMLLGFWWLGQPGAVERAGLREQRVRLQEDRPCTEDTVPDLFGKARLPEGLPRLPPRTSSPCSYRERTAQALPASLEATLLLLDEEHEGEEAFLDEADQDYDEDVYEAAEASDDDPLEALVQGV